MNATRLRGFSPIEDDYDANNFDSDANIDGDSADADDATGAAESVYYKARRWAFQQYRKKSNQRSYKRGAGFDRDLCPRPGRSKSTESADGLSGASDRQSNEGGQDDSPDHETAHHREAATGRTLTVSARAAPAQPVDPSTLPYLDLLHAATTAAQAKGHAQIDTQKIVGAAFAMLDYLDEHQTISPVAAFQQFILQAKTGRNASLPSLSASTLEDVVNAMKNLPRIDLGPTSERRKGWNLLAPLLVLAAQGSDSDLRRRVRAPITRMISRS